jgi:hypothetical protein
MYLSILNCTSVKQTVQWVLRRATWLREERGDKDGVMDDREDRKTNSGDRSTHRDRIIVSPIHRAVDAGLGPCNRNTPVMIRRQWVVKWYRPIDC